MIGWWPAKAVTFIDNHDTGSTQHMWPFPSDKVMQGYAYILTHPGNPCILYDHFFGWGLKEQIERLVSIRNRQGIDPDSELHIMESDADLYLAEIDGKVIIKDRPKIRCRAPHSRRLPGGRTRRWLRSPGENVSKSCASDTKILCTLACKFSLRIQDDSGPVLFGWSLCFLTVTCVFWSIYVRDYRETETYIYLLLI